MKQKGIKAVVCGAMGIIGGRTVKAPQASEAGEIRAANGKPADERRDRSKRAEHPPVDLKDERNSYLLKDGTAQIYERIEIAMFPAVAK